MVFVQMGFFAEAGPVQVFVSNHLIPDEFSFVAADEPSFVSADEAVRIVAGAEARLRIVGTRVDATEIVRTRPSVPLDLSPRLPTGSCYTRFTQGSCACCSSASERSKRTTSASSACRHSMLPAATCRVLGPAFDLQININMPKRRFEDLGTPVLCRRLCRPRNPDGAGCCMREPCRRAHLSFGLKVTGAAAISRL